MLLQFLTQNYVSIRDEKILSLVPSNDQEHPENIQIKGKSRALSTVAIYGANASGKSALFRAMTVALIILRSSNVRQINDTIPVVPFKFDEDTSKKPSKFEFTFVAGDDKKYIYGFSADQTQVHEEYLYRYGTNRPTLIFDRNGSDYKFSRSEKRLLEPLVRMNTANKLFLSTATIWNVESTAIPYKWLAEGIDSYTSDENIPGLAMNMYREESNENVRFARELLTRADINISDLQVEAKKIAVPQVPLLGGVVIAGQLIQPQEQFEVKIRTGHTVSDEGGTQKTYELELGEESLGTRQLVFLAPLLRQTLDSGKTLVIDELDSSLHPFIVKFLVNLFRDPRWNKNGSQLIFTTHDTTQLSLDTFRKDQIYFTEKDAKTGATDLYSLDEFSIRKTDNIEKGYLLGRYGAIPYLHTEEIV